MIKLLDILKESTYINSKGDIEDINNFAVYIEDGDIEDWGGEEDSIEGISVQALYYDTNEEEYMDIGEYPNPKK